MNFLLTGGTGFIGFNFAKKVLDQNHKLTLTTRNSPASRNLSRELIKLGAKAVDCNEPDYLSKLINSKEKFDVVVHLAANYSREHNQSDVRPMLDAAVTLGTEMLEVAKNQKIRFLHAGSYLEYMNQENQVNSLYVESKKIFEQLSMYYSKNESVAITKMIFFDTYGKGDNRDKVLNRMFAAKESKVKLNLRHPEHLIDLTHISDVVEGILQTVINPWVRVVRISTGNFIEVGNLNDAVTQNADICQLTSYAGATLRTNFPALEINPPDGWTPKMSLQNGLRSMQENEIDTGFDRV